MIDLFIIGGGINGTAIAAEAASRGLSVILCEKEDLSAGTSSASTKLIHGGLRYLEQYEFNLVHKALKERETLWHRAPNLITPLSFVLPYAKHLKPRWIMRLGLWLYDHLAKHQGLPSSRAIKLTNSPWGKSLRPQFTTGFIYTDCWTDDSRLVILNAIAARQKGAHIYTRQTVTNATSQDGSWTINTYDQVLQQSHQYQAKFLINATGPWVSLCQTECIPQSQSVEISLVKGSHIVVPKLYSGEHAYILMHTDHRVIFVLPYQENYTLIGTTDVPFEGNPRDVRISHEEVNYLCHVVNHYFEKNLSSEDVIWQFSGVRPLQQGDKNKPSEISRDYKLQWDLQNPETPLISVIGGKITTHRKLAEDLVDQLTPYFSHIASSKTEYVPLPGGDLEMALGEFIGKCQQQYSWLPASLCERYARAYGTQIHILLQNKDSLVEMGTDFGHGLYETEVAYLCQHEWALTTGDILWRRTKLGLVFDEQQKAKLGEYLELRFQQAS